MSNLELKGSELMFRTHNFGELMTGLTNGELSVGGKTLVRKIFNEMVRGTSKFYLDSSSISKGRECEDMAIKRIGKVMGWGLALNANRIGIELKDEYGIGHPDAIYTNRRIGFDAKCSFTDDSFPLFQTKLKDKNYIWQAKRLAMMAGFDGWWICYSLENTPELIVIKEAWKLWKETGEEGSPTESFIEDVRAMHNFDHLADWERVKSFYVPLEDKDIEAIKKHVGLARKYFDDLMEDYRQLKPNL